MQARRVVPTRGWPVYVAQCKRIGAHARGKKKFGLTDISRTFFLEVPIKPRLLLILLLGLFLAADAPGGNAGKKVTEKLEGTWTLIKVEVFGQASDVEGTKNTLTFKNDKITVKMPLANLDHEATYKVDLAKKPKQLDMMITSGPSKGKTVLFIYELEGDNLKVCGGDKQRPTEFATKKDDPNSQLIWVLKRPK